MEINYPIHYRRVSSIAKFGPREHYHIRQFFKNETTYKTLINTKINMAVEVVGVHIDSQYLQFHHTSTLENHTVPLQMKTVLSLVDSTRH